jgi:hypothetical protein
MSVCGNKQEEIIREVENVSDEFFCLEEKSELSQPIIPLKLNISMERRLERAFLESKQLGLSYSCFVAYVLEVLIVLNHRKDIA